MRVTYTCFRPLYRLAAVACAIAFCACRRTPEPATREPAFLTNVYQLRRYSRLFEGHPVVMAAQLIRNGGLSVTDPRVAAPTSLPATFHTKRAQDAARHLVPSLFGAVPSGRIALTEVCIVGVLRSGGARGYHFEIEEVGPYSPGGGCFVDRL